MSKPVKVKKAAGSGKPKGKTLHKHLGLLAGQSVMFTVKTEHEKHITFVFDNYVNKNSCEVVNQYTGEKIACLISDIKPVPLHA